MTNNMINSVYVHYIPKLVGKICNGAYSSIYKVKKKKW